LPFLEAVRPAVAIVSAGVDDPFGHPAQPTLDRLAASRAAVWRTDRDGEVTLRTDGRRLEVSAFSGRTRRWRPPVVPP
jgi:beta-lactamase superfamily II metal-dependent hydrolase